MAPRMEPFRFGDENPLTGTPFYRCWFRDLPASVCDVVETRLGMNREFWSGLVETGDMPEFVDPDEVHYRDTASPPVGEPFRLDGANPLNGKRYAHSLYRELPADAALTVTGMWGYTSESWDEFVTDEFPIPVVIA
ncbi:hypothetical protein ABZ805_06560 [Saccharopolyspora sp. NPDC047091]|uniref:hypothetical protein n=1 Tax=Saccharopolyspora sp. NPDC047091 TaxID=3155924 RepID=UPI0033F354F3